MFRYDLCFTKNVLHDVSFVRFLKGGTTVVKFFDG